MNKENRKLSFIKAVALVVISLGLISFNNCSQVNSTAVETSSSAEVQTITQKDCRTHVPKKHLSASPHIGEVIELLNELPKPVTVSCLVSHLPKPFDIYAVDNKISLQPSGGRRSPRIFIHFKNLMVSVVPDGQAKYNMELSEIVADRSSLKGDLLFPVEKQLMPDTFFSITSCGGCHRNEIKAELRGLKHAYASEVIAPDEYQRIPRDYLYNEAKTCNSAIEPYRCEMLRTIFVDGSARDIDVFPTSPQ
jgi:hypothetical protein